MKSILFIILSTLSLQSYAEGKYHCISGNVERTIEVLYTSPASKVPCSVKYTKPGSARVLWSAENEMGYCESKAKTFAIKLTNMGWSCSDVFNKIVGQLPKK